jgi:hypothetical protein
LLPTLGEFVASGDDNSLIHSSSLEFRFDAASVFGEETLILGSPDLCFVSEILFDVIEI